MSLDPSQWKFALALPFVILLSQVTVALAAVAAAFRLPTQAVPNGQPAQPKAPCARDPLLIRQGADTLRPCASIRPCQCLAFARFSLADLATLTVPDRGRSGRKPANLPVSKCPLPTMFESVRSCD